MIIKLKRIYIFSASLLFTMNMLSGCKSVNSSEIESNTITSDISVENGTQDGIIEPETETKVETDRWIDDFYVTDEEGKSINVNFRAVVNTDSMDEVINVREYYKYDFTDPKDKQALIEKIFDDGIAYYYEEGKLPRYYLSKKSEFLKSANEQFIFPLPEIAAEIDHIAEIIDFAPDDFLETDDYTADVFLGYIDGTAYVIKFDNNPNATAINMKYFMSIINSDFIYMEPYYYERITGTFEGKPEDVAKDYLKLLDAELVDGLEFSDMSRVNKNNAVIQYNVNFERNGTEGIIGRTEVSIWHEGLAKIIIHSPIEFTKTVEDVGLLGYSSILDIIKEELSENISYYKKYCTPALRVTYLKLKYMSISDENNPKLYSMIPVWDLGGSSMNFMYVNAMDGTIIR